MNEKLVALKTLGFNYITRDMDGVLKAWTHKPTRNVVCVIGKSEELRGKFGEETRVEEARSYGKEKEETKDGIYVKHSNFCCWKCDNTNMWKYQSIFINESNDDFEEITWDNSPFEIP